MIDKVRERKRERERKRKRKRERVMLAQLLKDNRDD